MFSITPQLIAQMSITATSTATLLYTLADTAGGATSTALKYYVDKDNDVIAIRPEDGDVRVAFGVVPTSSLGTIIKQGTKQYLKGDISTLKVIRVGSSNVVCEVTYFVGKGDEPEIGMVNEVTLDTSDIEIGAVELKDGTTDTRGIINAANTARVATDQVLLVQPINAAGVVISPASGMLDDSAFTPSVSAVQPVGYFADETATDSVEEGDIGAARMTLDRRIITASNFKEDTTHVAEDYLNAVATKRTDTAASSAGSDGDYATLNTDSVGKLWTRPDGGAASGATDNGNPVKIGGVYNSTAPVLTTGQRGDMQLDSSANSKVTQATLMAGEDGSNNVLATVQKKLASSTYSPLLFTNFGANATLNVKATTGNIFSIKCHNLNAAARYIQLHNTATVPTSAIGTVPLWTGLIPTGEEVIFGTDFFTNEGINFTTGIAFAFSTLEGTYTAGAAGDQFTVITYI